MGLDMFILDTNEIQTYFVCRNFNIGVRVNTYFKGEFYSGEVIKKWIDDNGVVGKEPWLLIKTDKKVDEENDALLNGHGLQGPAYGKDSTYFEDEPLPLGSKIYRKIIRIPATPEEISKYNETLPF